MIHSWIENATVVATLKVDGKENSEEYKRAEIMEHHNVGYLK